MGCSWACPGSELCCQRARLCNAQRVASKSWRPGLLQGSEDQKQGTFPAGSPCFSQQSLEQQHEVKTDRDLMVHVDEEVRGLWPGRNSGSRPWESR